MSSAHGALLIRPPTSGPVSSSALMKTARSSSGHLGSIHHVRLPKILWIHHSVLLASRGATLNAVARIISRSRSGVEAEIRAGSSSGAWVASRRCRRPPRYQTFSRAAGPRLRVGLVNNMPDRVLAATERQFHNIIQAADPGPRSSTCSCSRSPGSNVIPKYSSTMAARYRPAEAIAEAGLSALVVTGAKAGDGPLKLSPYWPDFARLVDLAAVSATLYSLVVPCRARRGRASRRDRAPRRSANKCSGFFSCSSEAILTRCCRAWSTTGSSRIRATMASPRRS